MSRVVVVDDYEPTLRMYATAVEKLLGAEVIPFTDPHEALRYVTSIEPALLVLDYNMPQMDGIAFVEALRGVPGRQSIPIIMLTGREDGDLKARALGAGVSVFLNKPVSAEEFAGHVRRLATPAQRNGEDEGPESKERPNGSERLIHQRDREALDALHRAYAARDPEGAARMKLASEIAVMLASTVRCSVGELQLLRDAAHVYDIGKLAIAERTLGASVQLSAQSRASIERHADAGAEILSFSGSALFTAASVMARSHHERWDGMGYPRKLKGEAIPFSGRVIAVADAFVALLHRRADRAAMTFGHALDQIRRESGTHFDPTIVQALERIKDRVVELLR